MARKSKDVDRDPELIADMTLLMLYLLSDKVGRGRSARWVAPTHWTQMLWTSSYETNSSKTMATAPSRSPNKD